MIEEWDVIPQNRVRTLASSMIEGNPGGGGALMYESDEPLPTEFQK